MTAPLVDRPTLEVGDVIPHARRRLPGQGTAAAATPRTGEEGPARPGGVPHRGVGRPHRRPPRPGRDRIAYEFLSSALPQVPGPGSRPLAGPGSGQRAAGGILPRRLHPAGRVVLNGPGQSGRAVRSAVPQPHGGDAAGRGGQPQALGRDAGRPVGVAHLGPDVAASSRTSTAWSRAAACRATPTASSTTRRAGWRVGRASSCRCGR